MQYYIVELSKYAIAGLMALFALEGFFALFRKGEGGGACVRQGVELFLVQFLAYLSLCLQTGQIEYLFFYAFLQIALFSTMALYRMIYPCSNRLVMNNMSMLLSVGFILLTRMDYDKALRQFFIAVAGLALALAIPFLMEKLEFLLKHLTWIYGFVGMAALLAVLLLGQVTQGSKISYTVAGITLQPSEFVKILFAFFEAGLLAKARTFPRLLLSALCGAAHVLALAASRDLGGSLIFFVGYLFMLLAAAHNYLYFGAGLLAGSASAVAGYHLFSHVRVRVQAFLDPFTSIDNEGYQMSQSLFAIAGGGWFGVGLYQGTPGDIPYAVSDFMFSAVAEELGGIFALGLILVCLSSFLAFLRISANIRDGFYRLAGCGLSVMYIFQVFLTVGGGMKFIPLTGVTLPLVSYGGSSVLTTLMMFAIMQGLQLISCRDGDTQETEDGEEDEEEEEEDGEEDEED